MASLSVTGIVRITRDAEERKTSAGSWYSFGIAAYRKNAKEGRQTVDFFDAEVYLKSELLSMSNSLRKGNLIFLENAFLRNDQFQGQDGIQKNRFKILIIRFEMLNEKINISASKDTFTAGTIHPSDLAAPINIPKEVKRVEKKIELIEENNFPLVDEEEIPF